MVPVAPSTQMHHALKMGCVQNGTHATFTTRRKQTEIGIHCIEDGHERMAEAEFSDFKSFVMTEQGVAVVREHPYFGVFVIMSKVR